MSDLCLVATMLAKIEMASQAASPEFTFKPVVNDLALDPRAVTAIATQQLHGSLQVELPQPEFSSELGPECDAAVERVIVHTRTDARTNPLPTSPLPKALRSPTTPQIQTDHVPLPKPQQQPRFLANYAGPRSGPQLYQQRLAALKAGRLYTRLPSDSYKSTWQNATQQPTYEDWKQLLALEARAVGGGQGNNQLSVILGDSISLWLPSEELPKGQLWLNQGISGDTTGGILRRLHLFNNTRPDHIYVMGGINDLRRGATDNEILWNLRLIMRELKRNHPKAEILVQSILPTGIGIPNDRIRNINQRLAAIAYEEGVKYLDLYSHFADAKGAMRAELTTDGLHLNAAGYTVWQSILREIEYLFALHDRGVYVS